MRLIFIRHAQSVANSQRRIQGRAEFDLSEEGRHQARRLRERFQREGLAPTHIYSSPQWRTAQTARIVSAAWPAAITYWNDLKEHDVGVFSGMTWEEAAEAYPQLHAAYQECGEWDLVDGAEILAERRDRAGRVVERMLGRHADDDIVMVFTHGGILQHIISALLGAPRTWGVPVSNTGVFDFSLDRGRWDMGDSHLPNSTLWRINRFNDSSHLDCA